MCWAFIVFRQGTGGKHSLISYWFASFKFPTCTKGGVRLESCEFEISHEGEGARTVNLLVLSLLLTTWKRELGFLISLSRSGEQSMNTLRFLNFKLSMFVILIILCLSGPVAKSSIGEKEEASSNRRIGRVQWLIELTCVLRNY